MCQICWGLHRNEASSTVDVSQSTQIPVETMMIHDKSWFIMAYLIIIIFQITIIRIYIYIYIYIHTYVLYVCAHTYTQWFFPIETVKLPAALQLWSCVARGWDLLAEILETENAKGPGGTGGATERLHICPLLLIHGICCDMSYDLVTYLMIFYLLRFYDM